MKYIKSSRKLDEHLVCNITFPLNIIQHGFIHKQAKVMLSAWDIPNMAYLSITNSNDYRNDIMTEQLAGRVVNLYRGYEISIQEVNILEIMDCLVYSNI